jgi:hypothetical protein
MLGAAAPYLVAITSMLFAASCALTLFYAVRHLDPPEPHVPPEPVHAPQKIAV